MELFDTHCHIHFPDYEADPNEVRLAAEKAGVSRLICVGCTVADSRLAISYAKRNESVWASVGMHPHDASLYVHNHKALQEFRELAAKPEVVALGETGLDYYYLNSPKKDQERILRFQLDIAKERGLPLIFHVRDAYDSFWRIIDEYKGLRGVVHSFTGSISDMKNALDRGLYIGLNGIVTFSKDKDHIDAVKNVPLDSVLLETDAPFLTPAPYRGKVCEPKHVRVTAEFLAELRGESLEKVAHVSTENALTLFGLHDYGSTTATGTGVEQA